LDQYGSGITSIIQVTSLDQIKPIKSLGQNFLRDKNIQTKIVEALDISSSDSILEIGPGEGAITDHLVSCSIDLTIIDKDSRAIALLRNKYKSIENIEIIEADILKYQDYKENTKIIGNLPYYISTQILFLLVTIRDISKISVIMLQKEVADRILSSPNCKEYGKLTVLLQTFFEIKKVIDVSPNCFYPKPKVWSTVIKMVSNDRHKDIDLEKYWIIIKTAFSQRRKQMKNTMKPISGFAHKPELVKFHHQRPENLSTNDFIEIYRAIYE